MKSITAAICRNTTIEQRREAFMFGFLDGHAGNPMDPYRRDIWMSVRRQYGFTSYGDLCTWPTDNDKLSKTAAMGLTCQSDIVSLLDGITVTACPNSGDCASMCVLNNGNGAYPVVQKSRDCKSQLFHDYPLPALYIYGYESGKGKAKGIELNRPNVNQDYDWNRILGHEFLGKFPQVFYGYTKRRNVLTDLLGGHNGNWHEAYSLNERDRNWSVLQEFLDRGGNIAVVTNRKPKTPISQWAERPYFPIEARVVDADLTDAWMLDNRGVIGDLSAKGKARRHIPTSNFIRKVYA